jgi:6-phosphogluconolactonase
MTLVFVGTYTHTTSKGIYAYNMDPATGALEPTGETAEMISPSFLTFDPAQKNLYAVSEVEEFEGSRGGSVSAFSIESGTGKMTPINTQPTIGTIPCHLNVDATTTRLVLANYGSGSVVVYPIRDDGGIGEMSEFVQHEGSSVNPDRQQGPHAHSVTIGPGNRFVYAADLGIDKLFTYELNIAAGKLTPAASPTVRLADGAGPRHFDIHPDGKRAYAVNELNSTITALTLDPDTGALDPVQTLSTIPEGFSGVTHCADVHVSPDGRFVYGSNRGHDSIAIFAIDQTTGDLSLVGNAPTLGKTPRNFAIDPTGTILLAANQDSDSVVTFHIDQQTGELHPTGDVAEVPMPVCVKLAPLA